MDYKLDYTPGNLKVVMCVMMRFITPFILQAKFLKNVSLIETEQAANDSACVVLCGDILCKVEVKTMHAVMICLAHCSNRGPKSLHQVHEHTSPQIEE